jgi:type IV secretory pathway TraG/TraD family ATPase VirD4
MNKTVVLVALGLALALGFHFGGVAGVQAGFLIWLALLVGSALVIFMLALLVGLVRLPFAKFADWQARRSVVFTSDGYVPPPSPEQQTFGDATVKTQGYARFANFIEAGLKGLVQLPAHANGVYLNVHIESAGKFASAENPSLEKWHGSRTLDLFYNGKKNILTLAPTREGKGVAAIIPTLLTYRQSVFVLDLKGENWFVTLPARLKMGQKVIMINPFNKFGKQLDAPDIMTNHHNPLDKLHPSQDDFTDKIQGICTSMLTVDHNSENAFFYELSQQLGVCLAAHLCSYKPEIEAGHNNLPYIRHIIGLSRVAFATYIANAYYNNPEPLVQENAGAFFVEIIDPKTGEKFYDTEKTIESFRLTFRSQTNFLTHPGIKEFLSCSDFDFADLRNQPTSIFCMMGFTDLERYYPFARLMIHCLFNAVITEPEPHTNHQETLVILDEQAYLGDMETLRKSVSAFPGYGVRVWSVFQDIHQMQTIYGKGWRTFTANAGITQIMTPNDPETAKEFSERAGYYTTTRTHTGQSVRKGQFGATLNGEGEQIGQENIKMPLLSPADLYDMPNMAAGKDARAVFFLNGLSFPFMTARDPYFGDKPNQAGYFRGMPYAPNPMERGNAAAAYAWMKDFLADNFPKEDRAA